MDDPPPPARAGGGVVYAEATDALRAFAEATGIPVAETQAGRGALASDHPSALGAVGATGTPAGNRLARGADLVLGVGTRWSDFTTASQSAFQDPGVRFVNVNVAAFDAAKQAGLAVEADARLGLDALREALTGHAADPAWSARAAAEAAAWDAEVVRLSGADHAPALSASTRRRGSGSSASTPTIARSTRRCRSATATLSSCRAGTTRSPRRPATPSTTST